MLSIIVAIAEKNAIGQGGGLLCHLPNDLKHFKEITSGKTVLMGRRTYFSLPRHPLPNRINIVISDIQGEQIEGAVMAYSIEEAVQLAQAPQPPIGGANYIAELQTPPLESGGAEVFIIGGGMIYKQFMSLADKLYITHIHHEFPNADTFFPEIDPAVWQLVKAEDYPADEKNPYPYTFAEYVRV